MSDGLNERSAEPGQPAAGPNELRSGEAETAPHHQDGQDPEEQPPLGSWNRMYALVLANLAFLIVLFYLFTKAFE
jgi:hypothetical protein